MGLSLTKAAIDKYFGFLTRLDNASKKKLIAKLTKSLNEEVQPKVDLQSLYGAWEDSRSSDEIIREIKEARKSKRDINF